MGFAIGAVEVLVDSLANLKRQAKQGPWVAAAAMHCRRQAAVHRGRQGTECSAAARFSAAASHRQSRAIARKPLLTSHNPTQKRSSPIRLHQEICCGRVGLRPQVRGYKTISGRSPFALFFFFFFLRSKSIHEAATTFTSTNGVELPGVLFRTPRFGDRYSLIGSFTPFPLWAMKC